MFVYSVCLCVCVFVYSVCVHNCVCANLSILSCSSDTPLTLEQSSRLNVRQNLGPANMDQLSQLGLEPDFELYVTSILDICDGREIKAVAVQALATEAKEREVQVKQPM